MNKTLWTTAAALVAAAALVTVLVPRAEASSPKTKFAAMKKAVKAKQAEGKVSLIVDGRPMEFRDGGSFEFRGGAASIILDPENADLSKLSAEERAELEKVMQEAKESGTSLGSEVWIDGQKVSREEAQKILKDLDIDINLTTNENGDIQIELDFSFDENAYSNMVFGTDQNTLILTPKKKKNTRYAVTLDPKTNLPSKVVTQSAKKGKWVTVSNSPFQYKTKKD